MITKKVTSVFTFGVFLLIVGVIMSLFENPQAMLIIAIGLVFELLAGIIFLWNKLKK
jgi:4-hydroxybenzoate polyprenyltransferase